jgi:hypothetical protein
MMLKFTYYLDDSLKKKEEIHRMSYAEHFRYKTSDFSSIHQR